MNFLRKIFSPVSLTLSIFILIYTFYKSEIYWANTKTDYYLIYYIFSILLIILSLITFLLNSKTKDYLIISIISILLGLYLFEVYLVTKVNKSSYKLKLLQRSNNYDFRTIYEIYDDLKTYQDNLSINLPPKNFIKKDNSIFPFSGISNSSTILCNESGEYAIYLSDRYGFNNPDFEWDKNEIEYLLVGDSFVHGYCVDRPNDIASQLRKLSNKSVLNLGYSGNGPLINYGTLKEYLNANVKKIIWFHTEKNDLKDLQYEIKNKILKNYLFSSDFKQNLRLQKKDIDELLKIYKEEVLSRSNNEISDQNSTPKQIDYIKAIKLENTRISLSRLLPKKYQANYHGMDLNFIKVMKLVKKISLINNSKLYIP